MERTAYTIYLIILTLSIVLFGAMHTYVYTLMSLGVLLAALLLLFKSVGKDYRTGKYLVRIQKTSLNVLFIGILAFLIFQLLPLPSSILAFLSPEASVVWQKSLPATSLVGGNNGTGCWHALANYVYPLRISIVRWVVYGLFFFGLIQTLNSRKRIKLLVYFILALGCFESLYGLFQAYSTPTHALWVDRGATKITAGTYINQNHFAGLMEMCLLLGAAFVGALSERKSAQQTGRKNKNSWRLRISALLSSEQWIQKRILILFAGVVMGVGLVSSASRSGIVAAAIGLLCMSLFFVFRKDQRRKGVVFVLLFLSIAAYSLDIGIDYVIGRFATLESSYDERKRLADRTIVLFEDYKLSGVGMGSFQYAYPRYQSVKDKKMYVRFAHNDWAQFLSEGGILGMVLLVTGMAVYIYGIIRLWRKRSDPFAVCLGIVPIAVLSALAVHSLSDFNLHIPANFLVLLAIMAIGHAALHLERHHRRDVMGYRYYNLPLKFRGGVVLVFILGLIGWTGYWNIRHFMAEAWCNTVPNSTMNRDQHPPVEEVLKAIAWDSGNGAYYFKLAEGLVREDGGRRTEGGGRKTEDSPVAGLDEWVRENAGMKDMAGVNPGNLWIAKVLERAVWLNPFDARYHLRLGWAYARLWEEKDYRIKWLPAADISMDRSAYFAGVKNPHLHQELGNYWIMRSRSVMPNDPVHHEAWAKAVWHYRKAQRLEGVSKGMIDQIRHYVWNFYPDEEMVSECLVQGR